MRLLIVTVVVLFCVVECATRTEVLIVGSGFGGSIAAYRLTQQGQKVTILEKGRSWEIKDPTKNETFPLLLQPDGRAGWLQEKTVAPGAPPYYGTPIDVTTGILEEVAATANIHDPGIKVRAQGVSVNNGVGVGGGSLIYNAAIVQPTEDNFDRIWGDSIYSDLFEELDETYWPKAKKMLKPKPIPDSILNSKYYSNARVFRDQAHNAGFDDESDWSKEPRHGIYKLDLAIDWDVVKDELDGDVVPSAIGGEIWYGMNSGAKFSLDRPGNYLERAINTGLVTLKTLHLVNRIQYDSSSKLYTVNALILDEDTGAVIDEEQFETEKLFLAAGSVMTSALLVRSKAVGDLPDLNEFTGKNWGNNGDAFGFRFASSSDINPAEGGPASFGLFYDDAPSDSTVLMNIPVLWATVSGLNNIIATLCMGIPSPDGEFTYDASSDTVTLNWPQVPRPDQDSYDAAQEAFSILNENNPGSSGALDPIASAAAVTGHPQGGFVLGKATDMDCEAYGYDGLFVVDGALVNGAAGTVNPAFTVAGFAERCMDRIISKHFDFSSASSGDSSNGSSNSSNDSSSAGNLQFFFAGLFLLAILI